MRPEFGLDHNATVWKFEEIAGLDVAALDEVRKGRLGTQAVKDRRFSRSGRTFGKMKIQEIEQVYRLSRATILGYTDPVKLREYAGAASCKTNSPSR